ncbi:ABC transporter ATP-binding protein [Corynebacterium aquatimens]|uniref:ABC transport system ATP-binding protein n=1 Tax=Corynebacterium aquatimens TaxID=1190508 RepID=A0A931E3T8_9CORY|nr:ABC transporter ATP-binding protein [Corynebacterium aquatimens]MBG6123115.1 putative ABC transport system ATP-binding protein [Corynebacterium aquatimens]WJY66553.1 putative ABC transporter ATP-binding protein [Corynebacterium aquatimens]
MHSVLQLRNVTVSFQDGQERRTVLDNINFTAKPGRLTFIVGESGSGKSTLLSVAAGLITPDSGTATLGGKTITNAVRRDHIGMIFQQPNLISALNVRDQLLVTDHIRGIKPRKDRADELLAAVGLDGLGDRTMNALSGGQRQRVGIARALMGEPELVLADEPTAALDSARSRDIVELLRTLVDQRGIACGFVTHEQSLIGDNDDVFAMDKYAAAPAVV